MSNTNQFIKSIDGGYINAAQIVKAVSVGTRTVQNRHDSFDVHNCYRRTLQGQQSVEYVQGAYLEQFVVDGRG